ncbi:MAG TPA: hypothetical protein VIL65_07875 [Beijerinckiaceae bacterium]
MTSRLIGLAGAALLLALAAPPASAQTAAQGVEAPNTPGDAKPAQRSRRKKAETRSAKEPTALQMAARERQRKCSAEWKTAKAGGKLAEGMKWPKFWSQCNARLKGNTA